MVTRESNLCSLCFYSMMYFVLVLGSWEQYSHIYYRVVLSIAHISIRYTENPAVTLKYNLYSVTQTVYKLNKGNSKRSELKMKNNGNRKSICWSASLMMVYFWVESWVFAKRPMRQTADRSKTNGRKIEQLRKKEKQKRNEYAPPRHHIPTICHSKLKLMSFWIK